MPPAIIAVVAAVAGGIASYAAGAALTGVVIAGITINAAVAAVIGSVVGAVVSMAVGYGLNAAFGTNKAAAKPATTQSAAEDRKQLVRAPIEARKLIYGRALVSGTMIYAASSGPDQRILHLVVVLAGHPVQAIGTVLLNDEPIPTTIQGSDGMVLSGKYANKVLIRRYDGTQTTADGGLVEESPDGWGADHAVRGCAYLYIRLEFDRDVHAAGLQSIRAEVYGKKDLYDPRTGLTVYANNFALCVLDYLRSPFGLACADDEIDFDRFASAANACDEQVQLDAAATEFQARYTLDGVVSLDRTPMDIMEEMLTAGGGTLTYVQGRYRLHPGTFAAPSDTLSADDLAGPVQLTTKPPRKELWNAARGTFVDPARSWQAAEFPPLSGTSYETADGERIWRELDLPFTIDVTRAQRLARLALRRSRESLTVKAPVRYAGVRYTVWQMLSVTMADFGWTAKPFRVVNWEFDPDAGLVNLILREESATSYAWLYDEAGLPDTTGDTTLVDPLAIPAPTNLLVSATSAINADGAAVGALEVSWTGAAHPFVTGHEVQFRVGTAPWNSVMVPGANWARITPTIAGATYEVRVRGTAGLARGAWAGSVTSSAVPDTTAPAAPTGLTATGVLRGIALRWANPADKDLKHVEVYERAPPAGSPYAKVGEARTDFFVRTGLPVAAQAVYRVRAVDLSGNLSGWSAEVAGQASLLVVDDIQDGIINTAKFAQGISPPTIETTLPTTGNFDGRLVFLTTDKKLYRWNGTAWTAAVPAVDVTGQLTDSQIAGLNAAKIAGQITAPQISDAAITDAKLATGYGANIIWNSCATRSMAGWVASDYGGVSAGSYGSSRGVFDGWTLPDVGGGYMYRPGTYSASAGGLAQWQPNSAYAGIAVTAGKRYQAAALLLPQRCNGAIDIRWFDATGSFISESDGSTVTAGGSAGGVSESLWARSSLVVTAPTGAATAVFRILWWGNGGTDPYLFWTKALFSEAPPNATTAGLWSPGGTTDLHGGMLVPASVGDAAIAALGATKVTGQLTDSQIAGLNAAKISGQIQDGQIAELAASKISGVLASALFPNSLRPVEVVASLPGTGNFAGRIVFLTTDNKLYRHNGTAFVASTPAADITGQIVAAQIAANTITSGQIAAGAIQAAQIAAGAIVASKLAIVDLTNAIQNPEFSYDGTNGTLDNWTGWDAVVARATAGVPASAPTPFVASETVKTGFQSLIHEGYIPVQPGEVYVLECVAASDGLTNASLQLQILAYNASKAGTTGVIGTGSIAAGTATWTKLTTQITVPATAGGTPTAYIRASVRVNGNAAPAGTWYVTQVKLRRAGGAELIVDGAIVASKIATDAVQAAHVSAGAITTGKIAAGSVTTEKLAVGAPTNVVWNGCGLVSEDGWQFGGSFTPSTAQRGPAPALWQLDGFGSFQLTAAAFTTGQVLDAFWAPGSGSVTQQIAAEPGDVWEAQALLLPKVGEALLYISWFNAAGTDLGGAAVSNTVLASSATDGKRRAAYTLAVARGTAPASTAYALLRVRLRGASGGAATNPLLYYTQVGFGRTVANATQAMPWVQGGATEIAGGMIRTGTVRAGALAADSVVAGNIAAGAVTAGRIAAGAIATNDLAANSITTDRIAAGAVTATQLAAGSVTANKVAANAITAAAIQAGSILASKLVLSNTDAIDPDPGFQDQEFWNWPSGGGYVSGVSDSTWPVPRALYVTRTGAQDFSSDFFPIERGATYRVKLHIWVNPAITGWVLPLVHNPNVAWILPTTGTVNSGIAGLPLAIDLGPLSGWYAFSGAFTVTGDNALQFRLAHNVSSSGFYVAWELTRAASADLIVDGAITATKIAAGSITTEKVAAGAIETGKLAAGSVTTEKLSVGSSNCIWNSTLADGATGWVVFNGGASATPITGSARGAGLAVWVLVGHGTGYLQIPTVSVSTGQTAVADWRPNSTIPGVPATAGKRYGAQVLLMPQRCHARLEMHFFAGDGTTLLSSHVGSTITPTGAPNGYVDSQYARSTVTAVAPTGTVYVLFRISLIGVTGNSDPYVFFTKTALGEMPINATDVGEWSPGGTIEMHGGMIKAQSITAGQIAANTITAAQIAADSITAGQIAAGAIGASEIAAGQINAGHLAATTIITSAAQMGTAVIGSAQIGDLVVTSAKIGNLQVGTGKIASSGVSDFLFASAANNLSVSPSAGWYSVTGLVAVQIQPTDDCKLVIICDPRQGFTEIAYTAVGGATGGGDGGGFGGEGPGD